MTQKYLGMALGFPEKSADVRLAQYENGSKTPKADVTVALAQALDVSPKALDVPDIDSYTGLMHTLFTLEDRYGLYVDEMDGEICLKVNVRKNKDAAQLHEMLCAWRQAQPCWRRVITPKRITTNGATITRSLTLPKNGQRSCLRD